MPVAKGKRVEQGIWRREDGKGYLAEVSYPDPASGVRIREQRSLHRLDMARDWRRSRKMDALRGEIVRRKDRPEEVSFERLCEEYLTGWSKAKKKASTYERDCFSVRVLSRAFGGRLIATITRRDVEAYIGRRKAEGIKAATANRELCCLKNMLRKAVDWGYLNTNPASGVAQDAEPIKAYEFLHSDEARAFIDASPPELRALFAVAVNTGMRWGELAGLRWQDVDFRQGEGGMITVRDAKNHETRHIPLNAAAKEALGSHPKRIVDGQVCELVWTRHDGEPFKDVRAGLRGALRRAGIEKKIRFHDLRHTFASHLVMRGVDLRTVAQLLGHKDIKMTMRYAHLAPKHLQAAVDALSWDGDEKDARTAARAV